MSSVALSKQVYDRMRQMFLEHRFTAGMKISETKLAKELGISRTPVREAIRQLENEGLLYQVAHSGTYITVPGRREISEIYEIRQALEVQAIEKAITRLKHEDLEQLSSLYQQMHQEVVAFRQSAAPVLAGDPLHRFLAADLSFHLVIFQAADNLTAIKMYTDVQMRNRGFGDQSHRRDERHLTSVLQSHSDILVAMQRQDVEAARQAMTVHIRNSLRDALSTFDEMPAPAGLPAVDGK
ncbi:MAG TPA: GntR family transcriptional regulator [Caulifigura sp.]|jgi:DNA-binding GntR family transcriptional regulator|nr:GntR family transcriptional regulator [Caulifigura sp.]